MDTADSPTPKISWFLWIEDGLWKNRALDYTKIRWFLWSKNGLWLHSGLSDPIFQLRLLPRLVRLLGPLHAKDLDRNAAGHNSESGLWGNPFPLDVRLGL
jgi:hypothetical protein